MSRLVAAFITFFLGGVVTLTLRIASNMPILQKVNPAYVFIPFAIGTIITGGLLLHKLYTWYRYCAPTAVEVFLLDETDRLYLYKHPIHEKHLPPGGRVGRLESIYDAITRTLKERIGLEANEYTLLSLTSTAETKMPDSKVTIQPCPFRVQEEHHRQRSNKALHLDFLFAARIKADAILKPDKRYKPARFFDIHEVEELARSKDTYPDVLDAYLAILAHNSREGQA